MDKKLLIVGRSSSGKTSIASAACDRLGLKLVKSYTTRPPRNEKEATDSKDHIFISKGDVARYEDNFAAYTEINGHKYFTTIDQLDECDAYVIDPNGIKSLKERCGNMFDFRIVYVRTSPAIAKERAKKRGDGEVFDSRTADEDAQFKQFEKDMPWDYHLLNNDSFERAVETMCKFMKKEFNL